MLAEESLHRHGPGKVVLCHGARDVVGLLVKKLGPTAVMLQGRRNQSPHLDVLRWPPWFTPGDYSSQGLKVRVHTSSPRKTRNVPVITLSLSQRVPSVNLEPSKVGVYDTTNLKRHHQWQVTSD